MCNTYMIRRYVKGDVELLLFEVTEEFADGVLRFK